MQSNESSNDHLREVKSFAQQSFEAGGNPKIIERGGFVKYCGRFYIVTSSTKKTISFMDEEDNTVNIKRSQEGEAEPQHEYLVGREKSFMLQSAAKSNKGKKRKR